MPLEEYYIVSSADAVDVADTIRTKGGTQAALTWPAGWKSAVNAISGGGITGLNLLKNIVQEQNPPLISDYWIQRSDYTTPTYINNEEAVITTQGNGTTSAWTTKHAFDFSRYSKLILKVKSVSGVYANNCRFCVSSTGQIANNNRGDLFINLFATNTETEFELTLPENKSSLYVGILAWTGASVVFTEVRAVE